MANEQRRNHRSKLYIAAKLKFDGATRSATIRNLSSAGALIDCHPAPSVGSEVELSRGGLTATGKAVWAKTSECGVHFDTPIDVHPWLRGQSSHADGQQRVDRTVAAIKEGRSPHLGPPTINPLTTEQVQKRLCEELGFVSRMLEALGDDLAGDAYVASRHAVRLQNLDIAKQILGHLAAILNASDPDAAIAQIGMEELRRRLSRRSL